MAKSDDSPAPLVLAGDSSPLPVVQVETGRCKPHPKNPRGKLSAGDVADLVESMRTAGQLQPVLLRAAGDRDFQIVVGHRRVRACEELGKNVLAVVVDLSEDQALGVLLAENATHSAPDPLREAEAVRTLLALEGWTLKSVADYLGKSPRWVAQRANLSNLSPAVAKLWRDGKLEEGGWTVSMLEDVAKVDLGVQDGLLPELRRVRTQGELRSFLSELLHRLADAPWSVGDADLLPAAGACSTCPKTSLRSPGLFDERDVACLDPKAADLKKAVCRDGNCWSAKVGAYWERKIATHRAEHPDLVLAEGPYLQDEPRNLWKPKEGTYVRSWQYATSKKGAKGARPALLISGKGRGTVIWIVPQSEDRGSGSSRPKAEKPAKPKKVSPAQRLKESKEAIARRRDAWVVDSIRNQVGDLGAWPRGSTGEDLLDLVGMAAAFACSEPEGLYGAKPTARKKLHALAASGTVAFSDSFWKRVRGHVVDQLKRANPEYLGDDLALALWVADRCVLYPEGKSPIDGDGPKEVAAAWRDAAIVAIPAPKWWPAGKGEKS